jgi:hypothetical protein
MSGLMKWRVRVIAAMVAALLGCKGEGGGTLETEKAATGLDGVALVRGWRLGATPGTNQASAGVAGIDPVLWPGDRNSDLVSERARRP